MYTVRQARANFKKMLDDAKYHPVAITRNGKTYLVVCKDSSYMAKKGSQVDNDIIEPAGPKVKPPIIQPMKRTRTDIIREVNKLEAEQKEALEYCQDPDEARQIRESYKEQLDPLWAEYRTLA